MQGICTSPHTGSQVMPRWCSSPISAAYSICEGLPPKLVGCGGRHGAGDAHLALATHLGARDRGVVFDDVAEQAGRANAR